MSYYDRYRDPQNEGQRVPIRPTDTIMGTTAPADVHVTTRLPGESNAPVTHSAFPASRGHKLPPVHVRAAHRRNVMINGDTGETYGHAIQHGLRVAAEGDSSHPDAYHDLRDKNMHVTVNAWDRESEPAGYVGGNIRMNEPTGVLRHIFGEPVSHPYTDPYHSGLVSSPSQRLMNADAYRRRPVPGVGALGQAATPDVSRGIADVLDAAGHGQQSEDEPEESGEQSEQESTESEAAPEPTPGAADPPSQGVYNVGGRMTHIRMTGPSSGGSTGRYGVATDLGDA